jgi:hypothetical protein
MDLQEEVNECKGQFEFIAELLRGDVRKRDHDGGGGHLEKGALTSTKNKTPYLDSTGPENQKRLASPEINALQAGRLMA